MALGILDVERNASTNEVRQPCFANRLDPVILDLHKDAPARKEIGLLGHPFQEFNGEFALAAAPQIQASRLPAQCVAFAPVVIAIEMRRRPIQKEPRVIRAASVGWIEWIEADSAVVLLSVVKDIADS
jgi:hypothetical protein